MERSKGKDYSFWNISVSRRGFLRVSAAGATVMSVGAACRGEKKPAVLYDENRGVRIVKTLDGIPIVCTFPDGQIVTLDVNQMRDVRNQAILANEPQVAFIKDFDDSKKSYTPNTEHPQVLELPKDVLPEEEVLRRGVQIIQPDTTRLNIRQGAFENDGPLAQFNNTGRRLIIALVDDYQIIRSTRGDKKYDNPRYDPVRNLTLTYKHIFPLDQSKPDFSQQIESSIETTKSDMVKIQAASANTYGIEQTLLEKKIEREIIKKIITYEDLDAYFNLFRFTRNDVPGQYFAPGNATQNNTVIFVAAGKASFLPNTFALGFDSQGNARYFNKRRGTETYSWDSRPKPSQTHPNPKNFRHNSNASPDDPKSYPYGGQTPGLILLHELTHDLMIIEYKRLGLQGPDRSEYVTDERAMDIIAKGSYKWVNSGYKDDSGMYFTWALPQEFGPGYIITGETDKFHKRLIA